MVDMVPLPYNQAMYIDIVPNRKSPPAILLRESVRHGKKIVKRTIANLSTLSIEQAHAIRKILRGEKLVRPEAHFDILRSSAHGHVDAVLLTIRRLGLDKLIASRRCKERDLVIAMIASRILCPQSKLALTRDWENTTLGELLDIEDADETALYGAMDWLYERQDSIEQRLAARHLQEGGRVIYDLSSSYFEGKKCPLAARGYSRDQKKGKLQVNYGLLTDDRGCPVSISAFSGNTSDPKTLMPQVERLLGAFNLKSVVLVGDRGMISQKQVNELKGHGVEWITALKTGAIRKLMNDESIQLTLFDERNLFELTHPDFPGEKLVACRNPELAYRRKHKREALLKATTEELEKVQGMVERGYLKDVDKIGVRAGRVINRYKMAKHFKLKIDEEEFGFEVDKEKVTEEAALDGIYVIRTSLKDELSAADTVRHYKALSQVERAFRSIKTMDLEVRPIRHYQENRVRAHLFLCMLAYYVKWHMMEAWRPLLFADEGQQAKQERDPVAPAERSSAAAEKARSKHLADGTPAHSFQTLLRNLAAIVRNTCRSRDADAGTPSFIMDTLPTQLQKKAFQLLKEIKL